VLLALLHQRLTQLLQQKHHCRMQHPDLVMSLTAMMCFPGQSLAPPHLLLL
jgi:hypothetical protein